MSERGDTVGIVGAGRFGTALAYLIGKAGRDVVLWTTTTEVADEINRDRRNSKRLPNVELPSAVRAVGSPAELCQAARFIVLAVAASDVRKRCRTLGEHADGGHILVHAIGSLAEPDDVRVSQVIDEETPVVRVGVLAGPALAEDLISGEIASMVCASEFDEVTQEAVRLIAAPPALRLYRGRDLVGVELAAALAGAYTVALGLADGLGVGPGPRATLITRAVAEGSRILRCAGADPSTFSGLAGLGNLLVRASGSASASPSYRYGRALASGESTDGALPVGARAADAALRLADRHGERSPVLRAVAAVVAGTHTAAEAAAMAAGTVAWQE